MYTISFIIPILFIIFSIFILSRVIKKGYSKKKAFLLQILTFGFVMIGTVFFSLNSLAKDEQDTISEVSSTEQSGSSAVTSNALGIGLIAAAIVTGLSGIGGGIAVASAAPAAIAATSEDPKSFGKSLIFVALGEGIALYGLLVSIMILNKLG